MSAFLVHSLLLGFFITSAVAQTRLDSSQVAPLKGDVQGAFANTTLRDLNSAADHGNGTTNAIASAIADCGLVNHSCSIIVPPSYGSAEKVPGYQLNFSTPPAAVTTDGKIAIFDRRSGDARMFVNNQGAVTGLINTLSGWIYNYYSKAAPNANLAGLYLRQWSLDGGSNQSVGALNYANKTTWATFLINAISHTPAQHITTNFVGQNTSIGTNIPLNNLVNCSGGYTTEGDLGCRAQDNYVIQGNVEYSGTLTGSPSAAATSLTVSPTQGATTQGAGRFLVRTSAGTLSAGIISQLAVNTPATVTGSGTAWPVSRVIAQLGVNVNLPGTAVVTPASFTTGSTSLITTNSLVCVSDQESFEMVYPTAVTTTTFTANFAKIHPSSAVISTGGLCGYLLDLTADDVTNATFPSKSQVITGTLHFAWPMIASTSPTSGTVWVAGDGVWQQLLSRWNAATANGYVLYPFAEVISTQQAGGLSDTLTLGPNNAGWAAGDSVSEFLYPSGHFLFGNSAVESYYPNAAATDGFSVKYNAPLQGNEAMISLLNNTPVSLYSSKGGTYRGPRGIHIVGPTRDTVLADLPADNATIGIGCSSPCTSSSLLVAAANSAYYDFLAYDAGNKRWTVSAGVNNVRYTMGASQFLTPFVNVSMAMDSNSTGYIATQQLRSTSATNSDTSGELVFSNAATAAQTLQGTYTSHPECWARPQFDMGSTNSYWISYSGNSFTVNFAAAVTGVVTYSCAARN